MRNSENQKLEYKDFSKMNGKSADLKEIKSTLFKEITGMANSSGGQVIVGVDDKTLDEIK